jgi:hypothetical protein
MHHDIVSARDRGERRRLREVGGARERDLVLVVALRRLAAREAHPKGFRFERAVDRDVLARAPLARKENLGQERALPERARVGRGAVAERLVHHRRRLGARGRGKPPHLEVRDHVETVGDFPVGSVPFRSHVPSRSA